MRFSADDACMDVTRSHTVNIATQNMYAERDHLKNAETALANYRGMKPASTHTFNSQAIFCCINSLFLHIGMETSMTASLKTDRKETEVNVTLSDLKASNMQFN